MPPNLAFFASGRIAPKTLEGELLGNTKIQAGETQFAIELASATHSQATF